MTSTRASGHTGSCSGTPPRRTNGIIYINCFFMSTICPSSRASSSPSRFIWLSKSPIQDSFSRRILAKIDCRFSIWRFNPCIVRVISSTFLLSSIPRPSLRMVSHRPWQRCAPMREIYSIPLVKRAARCRSEGPGSAARVLDSRYSSTVLARRPMPVRTGDDDRCRRNRLHGLVPRVGNRHSHLTGRRRTLRGEIGILLCQGLVLQGKRENGSDHVGAFGGIG